MKPTKTQGHCSDCGELNFYTATNCVRCEARLAWAFLIDGKDDSEFNQSTKGLFGWLFRKKQMPENSRICCRFCESEIAFDEKVCPHCDNLMKAPNFTRKNSRLVDKDAPHFQKLLKNYRLQKPPRPE